VCCQNVEEVAAAETAKVPAKYTRGVPPFTLPPIPSKFKDTTTSSANKPLVSIAVLTVSDRAANNEYEHGDLSGPAVCQSVRELTGWEVSTVAIVPDDSAAIQAKIKTWSSTNTENNNQNNGPIDLILTTGGTGFSPRDITPEATKEVVDHELPNLMTFCITECSHIQPLSSLSRGTAGILNSTLIANLPGNPKSIGEILPLLLPLLLHAVADLQESSETPEVAEIG
jgi:gephyrin